MRGSGETIMQLNLNEPHLIKAWYVKFRFVQLEFATLPIVQQLAEVARTSADDMAALVGLATPL